MPASDVKFGHSLRGEKMKRSAIRLWEAVFGPGLEAFSGEVCGYAVR
jgi:hypothetical protein